MFGLNKLAAGFFQITIPDKTSIKNETTRTGGLFQKPAVYWN